jgi:hypothetical protein
LDSGARGPVPHAAFPNKIALTWDTCHDESRLLKEITPLPLKEFQFHGFEGKRRVVSFGCRYDFSEHKVLPAEPIPALLRDVCRRIEHASGFALPHLE